MSIALINQVIAPRLYEEIRDRIGAILALELNNQFVLNPDDTINAKVWIERVVEFDLSELPAVNVSLHGGAFKGQTAKDVNATYTFSIDVYHSAESTDLTDGDSESVFRLQRLIGICQTIIEDSRYKYLGYEAGIIGSRHVQELILPEQPQSKKSDVDMYSVSRGRLMFIVGCTETGLPITKPTLIESITKAKLNNTEHGFIYDIVSA